jgi:hypothetical protein
MIEIMMIAVSGWLLLATPADRSLPLVEWDQLSAHDTARECEAARAEMSEQMMSAINYRIKVQGKRRLTEEERTMNAFLWGQLKARCVPSDLLGPDKK